MKLSFSLLALLLAIASSNAASKKLATIQWNARDCSSPLLLPEQQFEVSQFGRGKYRVDGGMSQGHFDCVYIIFQATNSLDPASVSGAIESTFTVKSKKVTWRSFKTVIEGRSVIRKETLLPNILPHKKEGNGSDFIWVRIDSFSQPILDKLTPVAESLLQDAAQ